LWPKARRPRHPQVPEAPCGGAVSRRMGRLARWSVPVLALALALVLGRLGREALPKLDESPQQYAARLLERSAVVAEDLYLQVLMLAPGSTLTASGAGGAAAGSAATAPAPAPAQDVLKQDMARDEDEISAQQEVSAKRYAEARREAGDAEEVVLPEQPDEVRRRMPRADPDGPEMRCGEAIRPESKLTTRGIELSARSSFQGGSGRHFSWKYVVTFANRGTETVQMLTRHWVFVDAKGQLETEVKGPGARGVTPVLPPGGEWTYESGTGLATPYGSMHGSFQFEVLKGDKSPGRRSFSARVGRLLLSHDSKARKVPCPDVADSDLLPSTSVLVTERVILGLRADFRRKKGKGYQFAYDVQFNNARETPMEVVGHLWEVVDSKGQRRTVAEGGGVGGVFRQRSRKLAAGDAFRTQGEFTSPTPLANAQGTYRVIVQGEDGLPAEIEARTDWIGLAAEQAEARVPDFVAAGGLR